MKIAALLLTAVVSLNSVDESLQGNCFGKCRSSKSSASPSPPPSPPPKRKPSPPRTTYPNLIPGSLIIKRVKLPQDTFFYKLDNENHFAEIFKRVDVVLNYERKIIAIFPEDWEHELFGLYHFRTGNRRIKLNPACIDKGSEHYDELDAAGYHYYPEFHRFEKPDSITIESLEDYEKLGRGLSCAHTHQMREWFDNFPPEAHIIAGFHFPEGFFFKIDRKGPYHPLELHDCDVVVDPFKNIVAVFLGRFEYKLFGIYIEEGGERVKLTDDSMQAEHFKYMNREESEIYQEFLPYKKPPEIYRTSLAQCG